MPERVIVHQHQSPGDALVLSAALRDISLMYKGRFDFIINVDNPQSYLHNPHVHIEKPIGRGRYIRAGYGAAIKQSNQRRLHFLWGFLEDLNAQLGTKAVLTEFRPALYLTEEEKKKPPLHTSKPYCVLLAGGKTDFTTKWYDTVYYQKVVDLLGDSVDFVQCGGTGGAAQNHIHRPLSGVINLVGKTSIRELICLIQHCRFVLCPITFAMHAAAALNKPAIVLGSCWEPKWWESYDAENRLVNMRHGIPNWNPPANDNTIFHKYLRMDKACVHGDGKGCWRRSVFGGNSVCHKPVPVVPGRHIAACMAAITPEMIASAYHDYVKELSLTDAPASVKVSESRLEITARPSLGHLLGGSVK